MRYIVFLLCGFFSATNFVSAQNLGGKNIGLKKKGLISVKPNLSTKVTYSQKIISMGDPIIIKIVVLSKKMLLIKPIEFDKPKFNNLSAPELISKYEQEEWSYTYIFELTFFDVGEFDIGEAKIYYRLANKKKKEKLFEEIIKLEKIKVTGFKINEKSKIKPFTRGLKVYFAWDYLAYSVLTLLLTILLMIRIIFWIKNSKKSSRELIDQRTAIDFFTQETELLREMLEGNSIELLEAVTQCDSNVKEYIERRYNIQIKENTNRENKEVLEKVLQRNFDECWQWLRNVENIKYNPKAIIDDLEACKTIINVSSKIINNLHQVSPLVDNINGRENS